MKKLLSVILCLSLLVALCIPAMAADSRTNAEASSRITLSNNTTLVSEDLPNGDARFTILGEDGCVLSESYLQRSEGLIHYESKLTDSFETRRIPTQTNGMHLQRSVSRGAANSYIPSDFTYRGSITYNFYGWTDHVIGTRILNVYYDCNYHTGSRYNVNGVYQDITTFASFLASILALPSAIASSFAKTIMGRFAFATGAISFAIPDHYVRAYETEITWLAQISDYPDVYATFTGSKFDLTEEGYAGQTHYSGDFCPLSYYKDHNTDFAVKLYTAAVGQDVIEIVSWS